MIWQFLSLRPDQILGHKKGVEEQEPSCLNKYALYTVLYCQDCKLIIRGKYHNDFIIYYIYENFLRFETELLLFLTNFLKFWLTGGEKFSRISELFLGNSTFFSLVTQFKLVLLLLFDVGWLRLASATSWLLMEVEIRTNGWWLVLNCHQQHRRCCNCCKSYFSCKLQQTCFNTSNNLRPGSW